MKASAQLQIPHLLIFKEMHVFKCLQPLLFFLKWHTCKSGHNHCILSIWDPGSRFSVSKVWVNQAQKLFVTRGRQQMHFTARTDKTKYKGSDPMSRDSWKYPDSEDQAHSLNHKLFEVKSFSSLF